MGVRFDFFPSWESFFLSGSLFSSVVWVYLISINFEAADPSYGCSWWQSIPPILCLFFSSQMLLFSLLPTSIRLVPHTTMAFVIFDHLRFDLQSLFTTICYDSSRKCVELWCSYRLGCSQHHHFLSGYCLCQQLCMCTATGFLHLVIGVFLCGCVRKVACVWLMRLARCSSIGGLGSCRSCWCTIVEVVEVDI